LANICSTTRAPIGFFDGQAFSLGPSVSLRARRNDELLDLAVREAEPLDGGEHFQGKSAADETGQVGLGPDLRSQRRAPPELAEDAFQNRLSCGHRQSAFLDLDNGGNLPTI
jgi:hypothetical protein